MVWRRLPSKLDLNSHGLSAIAELVVYCTCTEIATFILPVDFFYSAASAGLLHPSTNFWRNLTFLCGPVIDDSANFPCPIKSGFF